VVAADPVEVDQPAPQTEVREIVVDLGVGAWLAPQFPSAEEYRFSPWPIADLKFLRLPVVGEVVTGRPRAVTIYPAFRVIGERDEDDAAYLAGTDDVDLAVELGAGLRLQRGRVRGFAEVRTGVSGHSGVVADLGIDFIARQHERFELSAGPRMELASDDYVETYFGVDQGAAILAPYDPDPGIVSVGAEVEATYAITRQVRLHGRAAWNRFVGDAADSPIVEAGNRDEVRIGIGLSYRFGLDLF
jgi:outer membrane scaffolding protein for murein synthesis (MipA/OmpV family)